MKNMSETLFICPLPRLREDATAASYALTRLGYPTAFLKGAPKDGSLVLLMLDMDATAEEIFDAFPWIQEQFHFSSLKALRLMPFLFYHSRLGDVEEQAENGLTDALEAVLSGEFKPFGYDLDALEPLKEFPSGYLTYEE